MNRPNVLLIHCHDLGDYLSCYPGNSAATPNLQQLAEQGMVFDKYFCASPTCTPSRASMLTGLNPHRNGLMGLEANGHWQLDRNLATIPQVLKDDGYITAHYGVWHVSRSRQEFGVMQGNELYHPPNPAIHRADMLVDNAVDFLQRQTGEHPFFLTLGFQQPHLPWRNRSPLDIPQDELIVPGYLPDCAATRSDMADFYGDVKFLDERVGKVLRKVKELGVEENTITIFTTDHGIAMPLAKGTLYDPGCKIALIVRWPGHITPGSRCNCLLSNVDLFPTIVSLIGNSIPQNIDGNSFADALLDTDSAEIHDDIFSEQTWHDFYEPSRAIRTKRYKLIRNFEPGIGLQIAGDILFQTETVDAMREQLCEWPRPEYELYDLIEDPLERRNLVGQGAWKTVEDGLRHTLHSYLASTSDPILQGTVPCPPGYWEHMFGRPGARPGGLPITKADGRWFYIKIPHNSIGHTC